MSLESEKLHHLPFHISVNCMRLLFNFPSGGRNRFRLVHKERTARHSISVDVHIHFTGGLAVRVLVSPNPHNGKLFCRVHLTGKYKNIMEVVE